MNRYPLWKYIIVLVALVLGILYSLPNLFGESPAVQVSPTKATAEVNTALLEQVETALKRGNVQYETVFLDTNGVKARFANPETQIKAKDVLQNALGDDYVIALN
jgi:preprotein translocase subunit SecD